PDPEPGRDHAAEGEHPAHDRPELRGRVQLCPSMAAPRGGGRLSRHHPRRVGRKPGRDLCRQHGHRTARNRRRIRQRRHRQWHSSQLRQHRGRGDFLQNVNVTTDQAPDIIEKAAFDPGWGHYEIYGVQRFFSDNTLRCVLGPCVVGSTAMLGTADNKTTFGAGVGGSVLLPLIPKYLDFTASGLYGRGVGRYAAGQLPDVTIGLDGSLSVVRGWSAMVGLIAHPWEGLDVYAYAGMEQVDSNFFNVGTTLFGLGNTGFSNATCLVTTPFSFAGNTPADCI